MSAALAPRPAGLFEDEHEALRASFARFLADAAGPAVYAGWGELPGGLPRGFFSAAAEHGFVAMAVDEEHGGAGIEDPRFGAVLVEQAMRAGLPAVALGVGLHNDVCVPMLAAHGRREWLGPLAAGETVAALVGADDPLTATPADGGGWTLHGTGAAVIGGSAAGVLIIAVRTPAAADGDEPSGSDPGEPVLFAVEADRAGITRQPGQKRFGLQAADLADVVLDGVTVEPADRIGRPGDGLLGTVLTAQRLTVAIAAAAGARAALEWTVQYVHERRAFGQPLASFENTRMVLGTVAADAAATGAFVDGCLAAQVTGDLDPATAAAAKLRATELLGSATDAGVQLHGGYGYMTEYPIARAYADARMVRLLGGANDALRLVVAAAAGV